MHQLTSARRKLRRKASVRIISFVQITVTRLSRILLYLRGGFTVTTSCAIDPDQQYVYVANHQSRLDPFAVFAVLPLRENLHVAPARFLVAKSIYYSYLFLFLKACGCYPTKNFERTVAESVDLLRQGFSLFMFPEGRRTLRPESNPRPGASSIIQTASPELPFQVILIHIQWQKKSFGRRHVTISHKLAPDSLLEGDAQTLMDAVYAV